MQSTRLWITGTGLFTSLGANRLICWERLVRGETGIRPLTLFATEGYRSALAAEAPIAPAAFDDAHLLASRTSAMAITAAREAIDEARLFDRARVGLVVGGTTAGMFETEQIIAGLYAARGAVAQRNIDGREVARLRCHPLSSVAQSIEDEIGPFARVRSIASACSSGANALVVAAAWLVSGEVDAVVAGGSDGLSQLTFSGFSALGVMSSEPCRPFDKDRRGLTLGEGAGFVVLELAHRARARGVVPKAELAGFAVSSDAHHLTHPEPTGVRVHETIARALDRARLRSECIDYVNAHGTGTAQNDAMEARALGLAFGEDIERIVVSSAKGQVGHTLGASGAIEAALTAIAIAEQTLPPHVGLHERDPDLKLSLAGPRAVPSRVRAAVSNSFGFGGMNSVLVITEPEFGPPLVSRRTAAVVTGFHVVGTAGRQVEAELDPERSRRLSRAAQVATLASQGALASANLSSQRVGVTLGNAFGSLDGSGAYLEKLSARGPRFASPAEFPNLVPSAIAAHVSIYLGLSGATMVTADLLQSDLSAMFAALDLVEVQEVEAVVAGGVESSSVLLPFMHAAPRAGAESEVAAAVVFESESAAGSRGAKVFARVEQRLEWRGAVAGVGPQMVPPRGRAEVMVVRGEVDRPGLLPDSPWAAVPRSQVPDVNPGEARATVFVVEAVRRVATGILDSVLVIGCDVEGGYAVVLHAA